MMGFDFGDDRSDVGIGFDHGRVHFVTEGMPRSLLIVGWRRARFVGLLHCVPIRLLFRAQGGVSRHGGIVRCFQFLFLGVSQEVHVVVVGAAGRWA